MMQHARTRSMRSHTGRRGVLGRRDGMRRVDAFVLLIMVATLTSACGRRGGFENLMDLGVCHPNRGSFTTDIDNPYLPMPVGQRVDLQSDSLLVRITVLDEVEAVAGVET